MHIAIIGAGISGLMTALELAEQGCFVDIFIENTIRGDSQLFDADIHADNPIIQFNFYRIHLDTNRQIPIFTVELDARVVVFAIHGQRFVDFHPTDFFQQDTVAFRFQLDAVIVETRCGVAFGLESGMLGLPIEESFVGFAGILDRLFDDIVGNLVQPGVFFALLHLGDVPAQLIVADERPAKAMVHFLHPDRVVVGPASNASRLVEFGSFVCHNQTDLLRQNHLGSPLSIRKV